MSKADSEKGRAHKAPDLGDKKNLSIKLWP